jgi:opacity protein-like surface antigen
MRMSKFAIVGVVAAAMTIAGVVSTERDADAALVDVGLEGGLQKRNLGDTDYNWAAVIQAHADIALLPPFLMMGVYGGIQPTTSPINENIPLSSVHFYTIGARAKFTIPIPGPTDAYLIGGVGYVHGDFPDQTIIPCATVAGMRVCDPAAAQTVPNASANFVEFVLGAGLSLEIVDPVKLTLEVNYRPTVGYKNDVYEQQISKAEATMMTPTLPPPPGSNGHSIVALAGIQLAF